MNTDIREPQKGQGPRLFKAICTVWTCYAGTPLPHCNALDQERTLDYCIEQLCIPQVGFVQTGPN